MDLSFANPAGFWALLALPVPCWASIFSSVNRNESSRARCSSFDALSPVSAAGPPRGPAAQLSAALAATYHAVVLLAWLLAGPRWLRRDSSLRVVVVLDSSVSMLAFRDELGRARCHRGCVRWLARLPSTEWRLLETDPTRPTLYAGTELSGLLAALDRWTPHLGTHDFAPALNTARGLARETGTAVFVTDRPTGVPDGVDVLAVGHPLDNVGWVGVSVDGDRWRALVQNHSASAQTRSWHQEADGVVGADASLTLAPGQIRTLGGSFPAGKDRCELVLGADQFSLDDRLPLVRPEPKRLALFVGGTNEPGNFLHRFADSVPQAEIVDDPAKADVRLDVYSPGAPPATHAILFAPPAADGATFLSGDPLAENDPLSAGLTWNGLLSKQTEAIPAQKDDQTLVWQGDRSLIFLRGRNAERSLVVNFDVRQSNADRLPAFIVLLNRFLKTVREEKVAFERLNVETNQLLQVPGDPAGPPPRMPDGDATLRAPFAPGFFEVRQGDRVLLEAAAHFADAREADFKTAGSMDTLEGKTARMLEHNSREDFLWPFFALALGAVFLANWAATGRGRKASAATVKRGLPG